MSERLSYIKVLLGAALGGVIMLMGGWDHPLQVLVILVALDWISGVLASGVSGRINSSVGWKGIAKKVGYFVLVAVASTVDGLIVTGIPAVRIAVVLMLAGNEGISILENLTELGIPIPGFLRSALEKARKGDAA